MHHVSAHTHDGKGARMTEVTAAGDVPPRLTDYETERATFRIDVPERFNAVIDIIERWASEAPEDMALVSLDGQGTVVAEQTVADLARESPAPRARSWRSGSRRATRCS